MKRFMIGFGLLFWLFMLGTELGGEVESNPAAEAMLAKAVAKAPRCKPNVKKFTIDAQGNEELEQTKNDTEGLAEKLSLRTLFKPGRFELRREADSEFPDHSPKIVISFKPWESGYRLKASKGEDGDVNAALNELAGTVTIDPITASLVEVRANLASKVDYSRWYSLGMTLATLERVDLTYTQEWQRSRWCPTHLDAGVKISHPGPDFRKHYVGTFTCE